MQIVRYYHVVYQNRVNADAYHNEEALKTDSEQGFEVVVSYLPHSRFVIVANGIGDTEQ